MIHRIGEPVAWAVSLLFWAALSVVIAFAGGCGPNARSIAQTALSAQASVLVETQDARRDFYDVEHERCSDASEDYPGWRECMGPAYAVARAADAYAGALMAAQAAFDASGAEGFDAALPCLVQAASALAGALVAASIPVPEGVRSVLALGAGLAGRCGGQ